MARSRVTIAAALLGAAVMAALLLLAGSVGANPPAPGVAPPPMIFHVNYQGVLTDADGTPVSDGTYELTFRLYEQQSGGTPIWSQTRTVHTTDGLFNTILSVDPPLGVKAINNIWLGVQVTGDPDEMTPRQRLTGAPYAFTLIPGAGISGTVHISDSPSAMLNVVNMGTGRGLAVRTEGLGAGVYGESKQGYGGYFTSQESHALVVDGPILFQANLKRVAMHRWYEVNEAGITFQVGHAPKGILFDGGFLWVTNTDDNTVTKRRANDGSYVGTYPVGAAPIGMTYDGARLWVANSGEDTVTRLMASDPAISTTIEVGAQPNGLCFDGRYVWVVNRGINNVVRLMAANPVHVEVFYVGQSPRLCAFDGRNVWVTNHDSNDVTVLKASDGSLVRTVAVGNHPVGLVFDGANMWVANSGSNNVSKVRVSDGAVLGTFPVGAGPRGLTFDGAHIWVTNQADSTVTKLRARDGSLVGTYGVGAGPRGITFDGANIWVVNGNADSIAEM